MGLEPITDCWCGKPHVTEHGTVSGYRRELKLRREGHHIEPCGPCTKAANTYVQQWRAEHPDALQRATGKQQCRDRALRQLAQEYPVRFAELYDAEVRKMRHADSGQHTTQAA